MSDLDDDGNWNEANRAAQNRQAMLDHIHTNQGTAWELTPRLRWLRSDNGRGVLQQLWRSNKGEEWRDVEVEPTHVD